MTTRKQRTNTKTIQELESKHQSLILHNKELTEKVAAKEAEFEEQRKALTKQLRIARQNCDRLSAAHQEMSDKFTPIESRNRRNQTELELYRRQIAELQHSKKDCTARVASLEKDLTVANQAKEEARKVKESAVAVRALAEDKLRELKELNSMMIADIEASDIRHREKQAEVLAILEKAQVSFAHKLSVAGALASNRVEHAEAAAETVRRDALADRQAAEVEHARRRRNLLLMAGGGALATGLLAGGAGYIAGRFKRPRSSATQSRKQKKGRRKQPIVTKARKASMRPRRKDTVGKKRVRR